MASLCNSVWCDVLKSIVTGAVKLKGEACIIENGVFFRNQLKIRQDFPFVSLPTIVSSSRASLVTFVSLEPSTVPVEFSN